jgi:hypothetical protein
VDETSCIDNENNPDRNCYGACAADGRCQHLDSEGAPIAGALERPYTIGRDECKAGDKCG